MTAGLVEPDVVVAAPVCADVTAVLVTAGVTPYLVEALDAVAAQTRPPAVVLLVDVGGPRGAAELLDTTFADVPGVRTARTAVTAPAFGAAVAAGLAKLSTRTTWLWLLHDDCAPRPTALAELVDAAGQGTSVALAGPKQRTWTDPERLIEVGLTTTRGGRRVTAAVRGELDQGQHDATTDVLAVGTVAALVRQDVWQQVGTDPALGPFGDGLDLSRRVRLAGHRVVVVPRAVVRHAQASYLGLRPPVVELDRPDAQPLGAGPAGDPGRSLAARRRSAVHTQLVRAVWWAVPFVALAALVAAPVRALARLVAGEPALAGRELGGWAALARPHAIWRGRRGVARASVLPRRALWPLQATWRQVWAGASERRASRAGPARPRRSDLEAGELARLARRRRGGLALLLLALCAVSAAAWADLGARVLAGARLVGGALAFAPTTWDQAWTAATSGWVGEGLGSEGPADPLARVLAVGAAPVGGDVGVVVAVVLGAAAVAAGWGAWVAAGAATRSVPWRVWAALVWALAPGLLTATSTGRVGAVIAHVLLPWVVFGVVRSLGVYQVDEVCLPDDGPDDSTGARTAPWAPVLTDTPHDPARDEGVTYVQVGEDLSVRAGPWAPVLADTADPAPAEPPPPPRAARTAHPSRLALAATSLVLAVVWAGAPSLVVPSMVALVVVGVAVGGPAARRLPAVVVPGLVLLGPLLAAAWYGHGWRVLLADPGLAYTSEPADAVHRVLGVPSDALVATWVPHVLHTWWPALAGAVVLVVAVVGLFVDGPAARAVRAAWVVAVVGLVWTTLLVQVPVVHTAEHTGPVFLGPGVAFAQAGLLAAGLVGAERVTRAARESGRRPHKLLAGVMTSVAILVVAAGATSWVWNGREDRAGVHAVTSPVVPAVGQQAFARGSRVLVLAPADGPLRYRLLSADGVQAADQSVAAPTGADGAASELQGVVASLAAGSGEDGAHALADLAVAYVQVPRADDAARAELVGRLDATPGLERVTDGPSGTLWRVAGTAAGSPEVTSWARVVPRADGPATALPGDGRRVWAALAPADVDSTVLLAERTGPQWHAWLDGQRLAPVTIGWRQGFTVPAGASGRLVVAADDGGRTRWLVAQGLVLTVVLLVVVAEALPVRRRR